MRKATKYVSVGDRFNRASKLRSEARKYTEEIGKPTNYCSGDNVWFCPGVPMHKTITIVLSWFRSHLLAVVYCFVFCIGSCEPAHEGRT